MEKVGEGVLQQWLRADLKDCCDDAGCLGSFPRPGSGAKVIVNGPFCLQVSFSSVENFCFKFLIMCSAKKSFLDGRCTRSGRFRGFSERIFVTMDRSRLSIEKLVFTSSKRIQGASRRPGDH